MGSKAGALEDSSLLSRDEEGVKDANAMHLHGWVGDGALAGNPEGGVDFGQDTALGFGPAESEDPREWSPAWVRELNVGVVARKAEFGALFWWEDEGG